MCDLYGGCNRRGNEWTSWRYSQNIYSQLVHVSILVWFICRCKTIQSPTGVFVSLLKRETVVPYLGWAAPTGQTSGSRWPFPWAERSTATPSVRQRRGHEVYDAGTPTKYWSPTLTYFYCYFSKPCGPHRHVLIDGVHLMREAKMRRLSSGSQSCICVRP